MFLPLTLRLASSGDSWGFTLFSLCGEGEHVCTNVGAHRGQKALDPLELVTGDWETRSTSAWNSEQVLWRAARALAEPSCRHFYFHSVEWGVFLPSYCTQASAGPRMALWSRARGTTTPHSDRRRMGIRQEVLEEGEWPLSATQPHSSITPFHRYADAVRLLSITWARVLPHRAFIFWLEKRGSVVVDVLDFYGDGNWALHYLPLRIQGRKLLLKKRKTALVSLGFGSRAQNHSQDQWSGDCRREEPTKAHTVCAAKIGVQSVQTAWGRQRLSSRDGPGPRAHPAIDNGVPWLLRAGSVVSTQNRGRRWQTAAGLFFFGCLSAIPPFRQPLGGSGEREGRVFPVGLTVHSSCILGPQWLCPALMLSSLWVWIPHHSHRPSARAYQRLIAGVQPQDLNE